MIFFCKTIDTRIYMPQYVEELCLQDWSIISYKKMIVLGLEKILK